MIYLIHDGSKTAKAPIFTSSVADAMFERLRDRFTKILFIAYFRHKFTPSKGKWAPVYACSILINQNALNITMGYIP